MEPTSVGKPAKARQVTSPGGNDPLPEKPPTKEQIAKNLPSVLGAPELEGLISELDIRCAVTHDKIPKDDLALRRELLVPFLSKDTSTTVAYGLPAYQPIWRALWRLITSSKVEGKGLRDRLANLEGDDKEFVYLNKDHRWLPKPEDGSKPSPVTVFVRYAARPRGLNKKGSPEDPSPEPGRLAIFENGPELFRKLNSDSILESAAGGGSYRVGIFHGASGSGKTSAMLAAAVEAFQAEVVIHFRGALVAAAVPGGNFPVSTKARNRAVHDALLQVVRLAEPIRSVLEPPLQASNTATVAIIIDEMGGHRSMLRGVCAARSRIAKSITELLQVGKVVLLCGGIGLDTTDSHTERDPTAANQSDYYVVRDFEVQTKDWSDWLQGSRSGSNALICDWLAGNNTHLCRLANELLTNCRSAALLVNALLATVSSMDRQRVSHPLTIEHVIPSEILSCLLQVIKAFKNLNNLSRVDSGRAAELVWEAVALQMFAIKEDLNTLSPLPSDNSATKLLTEYGILTDTWACLDVEVTRSKRRDAPAEPRYRISQALVAMGRLGFGRLPPPSAALWASWEDDICHYFGALARSASAMTKDHMRPNCAVTLSLSLGSPGFQYVDDCTLNTLKPEEKGKLQLIEVIPSGLPFRRAFASKSLAIQMEPEMKPTSLARLVEDITATLQLCDFLVLRNAPMADYADVICVNNLSKELWLVQCKYSGVAGYMKVNLAEELQKMGQGVSPKHKAAVFTSDLLQQLHLNTRRYFICIAHEATSKGSPKVPAEFVASNVHVLEYPRVDFGVIQPHFTEKELTSWLEADWAEKGAESGSDSIEDGEATGSRMPLEGGWADEENVDEAFEEEALTQAVHDIEPSMQADEYHHRCTEVDVLGWETGYVEGAASRVEPRAKKELTRDLKRGAKRVNWEESGQPTSWSVGDENRQGESRTLSKAQRRPCSTLRRKRQREQETWQEAERGRK